MRTSEKINRSRGFISPSLSSDKNSVPEANLLNVSTALMVGKWAWRRLPKKISVMGLLAVGAFLGYRALNKGKAENFLNKMNLH